MGPTSASTATPYDTRWRARHLRTMPPRQPLGERQGYHHPPPTTRCRWQRIGPVGDSNAAGGTMATNSNWREPPFDRHQGGRAPISKGVNGVEPDGGMVLPWPPSNVGSGRANGGARFAPTHLQGWAHQRQRSRILLLSSSLFFGDSTKPKHELREPESESQMFWGPAELEQGIEE